MLNKSPATVRKFWTNCELSVLRTVNTPASFMRVASVMDRPGKSAVEAAPARRLGTTTRKRV
eukprot:scaffold8005_cov275-Amphora_coffeaeformis.AAC.7